MGMYPKNDVSGHVTAVDACSSATAGAPALIIAGGAGDATKVTGEGIDRLGKRGGSLEIAFLAALDDTETLSFAVEIQESDDDSSYDAAEVLQASAVAVTATSATNFRGVARISSDLIDLDSRKQFVRFNITPDLSRGATDEATFHAVLVMSDDILDAS